jgi:hypothetical protein
MHLSISPGVVLSPFLLSFPRKRTVTAFTEHVFNVAPHQNLTMVLALYFQLVLAK